MDADELNKRGDAESAAQAAAKVRAKMLENRAQHDAKYELACGPAGAPLTRTTTLPIDSASRKGYPMFEGVFKYFPAALAAVAKVSKVGNDKHNPGQPLHHARGKSMDHGDCILRHLMDLSEDMGHGVGYDEQGMPQVGYLVWRALALAQQWLEENEGAPLAPNARPL